MTNDLTAEHQKDAVNPDRVGTKARRATTSSSGRAKRRPSAPLDKNDCHKQFGWDFDHTFTKRPEEADEFYAYCDPGHLSGDASQPMIVPVWPPHCSSTSSTS